MRGKRKLSAVVRRTPSPSKVGDDPCFNCGKPGSTCQDCGEVICDACNVNSNAPTGHEPAAHLDPPPPHVETEIERLRRENVELERALTGTPEEWLQRKNDQLRTALAKRLIEQAVASLAAEESTPSPEDVS